MQITGIHHVAIICSNYEQSKKFYVEILGLSIIKETFRAERNSYKLDLAAGGSDPGLFHSKNGFQLLQAETTATLSLRHIVKAQVSIEVER